MQQIADWLEKLGMSEYAQRFAENGIDVAVLRHLTDQDLKDIGVSLGHRPKDAGGDRGALPTSRSRQSHQRHMPRSRSPKTPPSAAKSR